jgi:hypothetical protein
MYFCLFQIILTCAIDVPAIPFIKTRWKDTQNQWEENHIELHKPFEPSILIVMGSYLYWNMDGLNGATVGDIRQWADLIIALKLLKFNIHVPIYKEQVVNFLSYDVVVTDYAGISSNEKLKIFAEQNKEKMRILDVYGTQEKYNNAGTLPFCCLDLELKQYWTFLPRRDIYNSYLGIAFYPQNKFYNKKWQAVLWCKDVEYMFNHINVLRQISMYIPIITTVNSIPNELSMIVTNKKYLSHEKWINLVEESMWFIGLGNNPAGSGILEALMMGCHVLNPIYNPPLTRDDYRLAGKPTDQTFTSHNPYVESLSSLTSHVHNLDLFDFKSLEEHFTQTHSEWELNPEAHSFTPLHSNMSSFTQRAYNLVYNVHTQI